MITLQDTKTFQRLQGLKNKAEFAAVYHGHTLGLWKNNKLGSKCHCLNCNAWVQVEPCPAPNSIDIGGPAVAVTCKEIIK